MQADPLQQLRDVHLPMEPSWWPPAIGWWLLAMLLFGLLAAAGYYYRKHRLRRRPFESAQRLHKQMLLALNEDDITVTEYLHNANALLKRVFLHAQHDASSAPLSGAAWLAHLDRYVPGMPFSQATGRLLTQERFANNISDTSLAQLNQLQRDIDQVLSAAPNPSTSPSSALEQLNHD